MNIEQQTANRLSRMFVSTKLQESWSMANMHMKSVALGGGDSPFPVLYRGALDDSRFTFDSDSLIFAIMFSGDWFTGAAAEGASIAVGPLNVPKVSLIGASQFWFQSSKFCIAANPANQSIQRSPGFTFPTQLIRFVKAGTVAQFYGTLQTAIAWEFVCSLFFVRIPNYEQLMEQGLG